VVQDPAIRNPPPADTISAEIGKPDKAPTDAGYDRAVDPRYWEQCLADAERAEQPFRRRGREIVQIYRNEGPGTSSPKSPKNAGGQHYNLLYANTEVMLPAIYQKPPSPVVRSRFIQARKMVPIAPPMPMIPSMGPGAPPPGDMLPPGLPPGGPPSAPPPAPPLEAAASPGPAGGPPPGFLPGLPGGGPPPMPPPMPPPGMPPPGMMPPPPPMMAPVPPPGPKPEDIDTAAAIMEKALEIVVQEEASNVAVKQAIKDTLLPGRGVCRVRWNPKLIDKPVMAGDGSTPLPGGGVPGAPPPTQTVKIWETTNTEYVYWEDFLIDPVRQHVDAKWIAFRHLFTAAEMTAEFSGTPEFDKIVADGKLDTLLKWTEESAAKSPPSGGGYVKSAEQLGNVIKKAMLWEIWDKTDPANPRIIWFTRDSGGLGMRVDPDSLQLQGFFPIAMPMLAVTTSDTRIPRTYYDQYGKLAEDVETTSVRISRLTKQIKVRGAYNSASSDIANLLTAEDDKMIPVDGVDMINGGLQNHIWMLPIDIWSNAHDKLLMAREAQKAAIYEVMGISDIMRGATRASETATAQRIKGSMGVARLEDFKSAAATFARDLMALQAEIIAKNFDAETLTRMTGEEVTPEVMDILRDDFQRTCSIDIETDSTVQVDEQTEQQSMAQTMQSVQAVMQGAQAMLMTGILPPPQVIQLSLELLRMFLHPVRNSRGVIELLDDFKEQLEASIAMSPPPMLGAPPPGGPPPGGGPQAGPIKEPGGPAGAGPRPGTMNGPPPQPNGALS
jgi:hypothetical protein